MQATVSSLSLSLKEQTKESHRWLERKLIGQIKDIESVADYATILTHFYSFFGGLEAAIEKVSVVSFLPDYLTRRKSAALADDLTALHASIPSFANRNILPVIEDDLQVAGALYVIEGSTLGGVHIAEMIRKKLSMPGLDAFSFFDGYGTQTIKMWQTFQEALNTISIKKEEEEIIIKAANDTFIGFDKLLRIAK